MLKPLVPLKHARSSGFKLLCHSLCILAIIFATTCSHVLEASFVDTSTIKPSIALIVPQTFRVPTNIQQVDGEQTTGNKLQQFVAVINHIQNERDEQLLRQQYKRLSLQIRDASSPITGQLFYEHVFDYFPPSPQQQHLLIPINLDQVSPVVHEQLVPIAPELETSVVNKNSDNRNVASRTQHLYVSIRPHQLETGFGSDGIEFVSSAPVPVVAVPSNDGRRTFAIVQTDKPIYKPEDKVRIRLLVINEDLRPVTKEELRLQVKNPHKVVVEEISFPNHPNANRTTVNFFGNTTINEPLFLDYVFEFPPEPMLGVWTLHMLHADPIASDTTSFEVKEYVLPTYEIDFDSPKYILPGTHTITGSITAKYHHGKPVQGKAQFKFGLLDNKLQLDFLARSSIRDIDQVTGRVDFRIQSDKFKERKLWLPEIEGYRFVVEATVTETATGHSEVVQDTSSVFITKPYRFSFANSIEDFRPGLYQQLTVQILEMQTDKPAPAGAHILAQYKDENDTLLGPFDSLAANNQPVDFRQMLDAEAYTNSEGRATFNVGPIRDDIKMLKVELRWPNMTNHRQGSAQTQQTSDRSKIVSTAEDLAYGRHDLMKHDSRNGWLSLMNKTITHLNVGDEFVSDLLIRDAVVIAQKIYYVIVAHGQIIDLKTLNSDGLVKFTITESMVPTIRIVLFALSHDSVGLLSDSMRLNVAQDWGCGLSVKYKSNSTNSSRVNITTTFRPNDKGELAIQARQGDLVSLIGVDSAVYTLNNRSRLLSSRIVERVRKLDSGCGFGGGKNNLDVFLNAGLMFSRNVFSSGSFETIAQTQLGSACLKNQIELMEDIQRGYERPFFVEAAKTNRLRMLNLASTISRGISSGLSKRLSRNKRDVYVKAILDRYKDPNHKSCCLLGTIEDHPQHRNCSVREEIVERYMNGPGSNYCASIYSDCCLKVFEQRNLLYSSLYHAREQDEQIIIPRKSKPIYMHNEPEFSVTSISDLERAEAETLVRKDFRETWLFDLVPVDEADGTAKHEIQLPHSMTAWSISAMALNRNKPMCIMAKPLKLTTFQEIFLQVSMPYKVVQGEQIDLVATVFNYASTRQEVLVYMYGIEDVCSEAEAGERSERKRIRIEKKSSQSVLFPMIPLKTGKYPIKILAITTNSNSSDIVERQLNVVPRGKPVTDETTFSLDPMNQQRRSKRSIQTGNLIDDIDSTKGVQHTQVRLTPTRDSDNIVPQTQECIVSAIGDKMGQSVQTTMLDVENLIRLPHGCGEQVMIYLGPTLYTTRYLSAINKLTGELRWRAIRYIQSGYKRILNYRKEDGAFSAFARRDPSIWLTAFIAKMLCQTERTPFVAEEIHVDKTVVNSALEWLIRKQDNDTGTWVEMNPVYHREMLGGVLKENALTAFVTLSLNECAHHSSDLVEESDIDEVDEADRASASIRHLHTNGLDRLRVAAQKAEQAIMLDRYKAVKERNPYVLALTAYALSFSRPRDAVYVLNDLMLLADRSHARNQLYWKGDYPIETASYALQALIELAPIVDASVQSPTSGQRSSWSSGPDMISISNWLASRRSYSGAFESTQDTVVALEALSKLAQLQSAPNRAGLVPSQSSAPSLVCNVTINSSNRTRRSIEFGKDNSQVLQIIKIDPIPVLDFDQPINGGLIDIVTSGNGIGIMSVKYKYNVFQEEEELCRFDIDSAIEEWRPNKIRTEDGKNNNVDGNQSEEEIGDDVFKNFDKSMLYELNVINPDQLNKQSQIRQKQIPTTQTMTQNRVLRTRRASGNDTSSSSFDRWTTKVVSNIKSKLPWLSPSRTTTTTPRPPTTAISTPVDRFDTAAYMSDATSKPKTSTSRRSAQDSSLSHMIVRPGSIPDDAKLNLLSNHLDVGNQNHNNTNSSANLHNTQSIELSSKLVLLLRVCVRHMAQRDSGMAIIEIGILSGFTPNEADLQEIVNGVNTPAMKYEISGDKSLVIIYMQYIPFTGPHCIQFRQIRNSLVYNLQSGYIRAYEYYSPTLSCSNFYTPTRVTNLIDTKCDFSGQVCQCASKSLCPATRKLEELGEIHAKNSTSARNRLKELACSNRYDLIASVRLMSVKNMPSGKMLKLFVRIRYDLKGNLSKIIEAQRQQKTLVPGGSVRKPSSLLIDPSLPVDTTGDTNDSGDNNSLDQLELSIDYTCVRGDQFLGHFAHQDQLKQGGKDMILFANSKNLVKNYHKTARESPRISSPSYPRPTPNVLRGQKKPDNNINSPQGLHFDDSLQFQYSTSMLLDRDTILHDTTYQAKGEMRKTINDLIQWYEIRGKEICSH